MPPLYNLYRKVQRETPIPTATHFHSIGENQGEAPTLSPQAAVLSLSTYEGCNTNKQISFTATT